MNSQMKAQEALNELNPETRRLMIERALTEQDAGAPLAPANDVQQSEVIDVKSKTVE